MHIQKRKKTVQRIIAGVLLILMVSVGMFFNARKTQANWFDDNWAYRKAINITGHTTSENNVYLNLTGGSALDSQGASKANCGDIRFTDVNGKVLPYFIVSGCKTASTVVHVFFDTFPAGAQTIYYYYGNPSARDGFSRSDFSTAATGVTFGSYGSQEVGPGPVAYWKFDEGYGTVINSNTQTGPSMTLSFGTGAPWTSEERCVSGKCLYFNATGNVTANASISSIKTVQFWVKPRTNSGTLFDADGTASLAFIVATNGTITAPGFTSPSFYINGVYTTSPILVANVWQHITVTTNSSVTMSAVTMGELGGPPTFTGFIDEVKLYRTVRTASEIKSDAQRWVGAEGSSAVLSGQDPRKVGPLSNGLLGYWKIDEASWTNDCATATVMDASGNGTHGLSCPASTGPTGGSSGKYGNGALYDYVDNFISINNSTVYAPMNAPFSASAWVYLNSFSDQYPTILRLRSDDTQPWFIIFSNQTNYLGVSIGNNANFAGIKTDVPSGNLTGAWRHVVATYNGKGSRNINNFKIFLDGVLLTNSASGAYASHSQATSIGYNSTGNRWNGYIDEVRVYSKELTLDEAKSLYSWTPGPFAHYDFDTNSGVPTTIPDRSGNNFNGAVSGSMTGSDWVTGKYGSALKFDGVNDRVNIYSAGFANAFNGAQGAITAWIRIPDAAAWADNSQNRSAIALAPDISNYIRFVKPASANGLTINYMAGGTVEGFDYATSRTDWFHVSLVWNKPQDYTEIYIDGELVDRDTALGTWVGSLATTRANIGARLSDGTDPFKGHIDDVRIYNYPITTTQVVEDMNAGRVYSNSFPGTPYLYWKFDEGYGATVNNSGSGHSANGSISGGVWKLDGKRGKGIHMFNSADYVSAGDLDFIQGSNSLTVSLWMNPQVLQTNKAIISKSTFSFNNNFAVVTDATNADEVRVHIPTSVSDTGTYLTTTDLNLSVRSWTHLTVTFDGTQTEGEKVKIYKNGVEVSKTITGTLPSRITQYASSNIKLGASDSGSYTALNSLYDEVKIHSIALSKNDVLREYNGGSAIQFGSVSTSSDGLTASNSASRVYCVPGDTSTCGAPIVDFTMDEGQGLTLYDAASNSTTGTLLDFAVSNAHWVTGKSGKSVLFDGNENYVDFYSSQLNSLFSGSQGTAMIWFKVKDAGVWTDNTTDNLFKVGPDLNNSIHVQKDTNGILGFTYSAGGVNENAYVTVNSLGWSHIAITWDKTNEQVRYYLNGSLIETDTALGVWSGGLSSTRTTIGNNYNGTSGWNGSLDGFRLYNYTRTPSQIAWDYNRGAPVAWYKFNECQGTIAYNSAPSASIQKGLYNGTITIGGTGSYTSAGRCRSGVSTESWNAGTTGKFGSALAFDAINDNVNLGDNFDFVGNSFSVCAWVYPTGSTNDGYILGKFDVSTNKGFWLRREYNTGYTTGTVGGGGIEALNSVSLDQWQHICAVIIPTPGTSSIYKNGIRLSSLTTVAATEDNSRAMVIGDRYDGLRPFSGMIDDVRIYNYPLTDLQIKTVMNEGSAVRFGP